MQIRVVPQLNRVLAPEPPRPLPGYGSPEKLITAGFTSVPEVHECSALQLMQEAGLSRDEVTQLKADLLVHGPPSTTASTSPAASPRSATEANPAAQPGFTTASALASGASSSSSRPPVSHVGQPAAESSGSAWLVQPTTPQFIITFCQALDTLLGGGVPLGEVTEFAAPPGLGKTQLCMQLAVDTTVPHALGGVQGDVLYIDTEGSMVPARLHAMAQALVAHLQVAAEHSAATSPSSSGATALAPQAMTAEQVLGRIHVQRVLSAAELLAAVLNLRAWLAEHTAVRLVVIDSIAFHLRAESDKAGSTSRMVASLAQELLSVAAAAHVAVVTTNHMTARMQQSALGQSRLLVPALGEAWAHAVTHRVAMQWVEGERCAVLNKSPSRPTGWCTYAVTPAGVRKADSR